MLVASVVMFLSVSGKANALPQQSLEFCSQKAAEHYIESGIDTTEELAAAGINGRPQEIIENYIKNKEEVARKAREAARAEAARKAAEAARKAATTTTTKTTSTAKTTTSVPTTTVKPGDKSGLIRSIASSLGYSAEEINMLLYIAEHESNCGRHPQTYNSSRKYIGIFQLGPHLGSTEQRLNDDYNIRRAIRYMVGRYGSIAKAYQFKRANGWY